MIGLRKTATALLLAWSLGLAGCGAGGGSGSGEGEVIAVDADKAQITLDHDEIPGMMSAMTMTFAVSDPGLLKGVEAGDEVSFELRYADGVHTVIALERH